MHGIRMGGCIGVNFLFAGLRLTRGLLGGTALTPIGASCGTAYGILAKAVHACGKASCVGFDGLHGGTRGDGVGIGGCRHGLSVVAIPTLYLRQRPRQRDCNDGKQRYEQYPPPVATEETGFAMHSHATLRCGLRRLCRSRRSAQHADVRRRFGLILFLFLLLFVRCHGRSRRKAGGHQRRNVRRAALARHGAQRSVRSRCSGFGFF